ncbi:MAG TPA: class I SAM-dependent methyltransferase [Chitinophagaceae bacterium]|nr:class I SAM-dependent methyltransferase [Chitinophagaceae bacterium]
MIVKSPVTLSNNTKLIETIPVKTIIEQYRSLLDMDVSNYFTGLDNIYMYECLDTGFRFYYPENIFGDEAFYAELQKKDFYYNPWIWENKAALNNIKPGSKILEVGCGTGSFLQVMQKKGFDCTGVELNQSAVDVCRQKGLNVFKQLLEEHVIEHSEMYDVVCSFQVLEHVYDVHSFITSSLKCLKPGGKLIMAVPNNNPWFLKYDKLNTLNMPPHHSGLWNKETFLQLPRFFPVKVIRILIEPIYDRMPFLYVYLKHFKLNLLYKIFKSIPPGITNRGLLPLKWFVKGKCVLAIFEKK